MITKTLKTAAGVTFAAMLLGATAVSAKTLVYCSEGSPENFTPAINTTGTSFDAARPVYDKLVAFKRGTTEVEPSLAESWDVTDGGKTITFKRPDGKSASGYLAEPAKAKGPGVAVIQFGPSIAKPVIRGLNSQRVLVMNGGLRQEDQQWGTEHAPNIDSFDADAVSVVRGAATVLYGAGPRTLVEANGHRADEKVRLDDLYKATEVVALALFDLLGGAA